MIERFDRPTPRLQRALAVARVAHEGAVRKGTRIPYIEHPVAVALILESHGYPEDLIVAGLLHDTVEDTTYDNPNLQARMSALAGPARLPCPAEAMAFRSAFLDFLAAEFGADVLRLVLSVTEAKNDGGVPLDWLERKKAQLNRLCGASPDEAALKAADALHNIQATVADIRKLGLGVLDRFRGGPLLVWHYSATAELAAGQMAGGSPLAELVRDAAHELTRLVRELRPDGAGGRYPPPNVV